MSDEEIEECGELINDLGLDFMCEDCGTELSIFDDECSECGEYTRWSTDFQVREVREELNERGYDE